MTYIKGKLERLVKVTHDVESLNLIGKRYIVYNDDSNTLAIFNTTT